MKMRQKLAAVLAASMVLTAMPVLTMAKANFSISTGIKVNEKDEPVSTGLKVEMKDATNEEFVFFVNLDKAEFLTKGSDFLEATQFEEINGKKAIGNTPTENNGVVTIAGESLKVEYNKTGDKEMKVTVTPQNNKITKGIFTLPIDVKLKGGDATVEVDGAGSVVTDMSPVVFARTNDKKATVKADDAESIYKETKKVAKITVEEPFKNAVKDGSVIDFAVKHSDYKIMGCTIKTEKGFALVNPSTNADSAKREEENQAKLKSLFHINANDDGTATFTFDEHVIKRDSLAAGRLTFELELKSTEKKPSTGKLNVKVSGKDVDDQTVTVAEVKDYGTTIEMKDKKVVDVVAGQSEDITFTIKESVGKTFTVGREFDVELENGFLSPIENMKKGTGKTTDNKVVKYQERLLMDELQSVVDKVDDVDLTVTDIIYDDDDFAVGFTVSVDKYNKFDPEKDGELEMEMKDVKVYVPVNYSGDVKVKASGRALGYDASTVAINSKKPVEIKTEPITVKVGLKSQLGGKIEIKETEKGIFEQGEYLLIKVDSDEKGLKVKDAVAKVTSGDLQIDSDNLKFVNDNTIAVKIKRASDEASTITLTDIELYSDRTVPEGKFSLNVAGRAIADDWTLVDKANEKDTLKAVETSKGDYKDVSMVKSIEVENFVVIGTPNTEDITTANGLRKGTASFVIGSTKYVVNGKEAEMPVAAYTENGRTMIPVRFVANALGIDDTEITYAKGTANVMVGSKMYSFKIGDKVAYINGMPARTMLTAPVLKNDRCFVPVAELGELLGAEMNWDAATQTATFTVK